MFYLFTYFYLFFTIYFWLHWVFVAVCGPSLVVTSRGYSSLQCVAIASLAVEHRLLAQTSVVEAHRLSSCGLQALEYRLPCCGAWS